MITWKIKKSDPAIIKRLMEEFRAPEIIARVMANRGLKSLTNSRSFFDEQYGQGGKCPSTKHN